MEYEDYLEQCMDKARKLIWQSGILLFDSPYDDDDYRDPDDDEDDDPEINLTETEIDWARSEAYDQGYRECLTIKNFEKAFEENFFQGYESGEE